MSTSAAAAAARAQIQYAMNMDEDHLGRVGGSPDGNGNGNNGSSTPKYAPSSFYADSEDSFATAHSHYSSRSQSLPMGDIDHDDLLALGGGDDAEDCSEYDVVSAHGSSFTTSSSSYLKGRTKALVLVVISVVVLCTGWWTLAAGGGDHATADMEEEMGIVQDEVAPSSAASAKHDKNDNNDNNEEGKDDGDKQHTSNTNGQNSQSFPALTDLISSDGSTVKPNADISWMLDFSIAGFAKSGTTFLMNYLRRHNDETVIHKGEVHNLRSDHGAADIVTMFYDYHLEDYENARTQQQKQHQQKQKQKHHKGKGNSLDSTTAGQRRRYGIKSPTELETEFTLSNYATYFPSTDFIVSLRHPVKWFESFYNFRQYHHYPHLLPFNTTTLIGECEPGWPYKPTCMTSCPSGKMDVCTTRANFHWALSRLGKTSMTSRQEMELLSHHEMSVVPRGKLTGRVFVMENRQIIFGHPSSQNFTVDLKHFVGLRRDLPPLEPYVPPKDKYASFSNKEAVKKLIHICDAEHAEVREELVRIGKEAATWIRQYFVKSPDVVVTAPAEFDKLLEDWGVDPCVPDSGADADANGDVDEDDGSIGGAEHGGTRWRRRWRRRRGRRHLLDELAAMPD